MTECKVCGEPAQKHYNGTCDTCYEDKMRRQLRDKIRESELETGQAKGQPQHDVNRPSRWSSIHSGSYR